MPYFLLETYQSTSKAGLVIIRNTMRPFQQDPSEWPVNAPLRLLSKATGSQLCHTRLTAIIYHFLKCKGEMFQLPCTPQHTCSILQKKPSSPGKHRSTEPEAAVVTQTVPVTPGSHPLPPHQTTPHAPTVEGLFNPSYLYSYCAFNQRRPAHPSALS